MQSTNSEIKIHTKKVAIITLLIFIVAITISIFAVYKSKRPPVSGAWDIEAAKKLLDENAHNKARWEF